MTRPELVNKRTREAVRDQISGTVLRDIDEMWQDELFAPPEADPEPVGGERVTRFQGYLEQVDWADPGHVVRALRVFEVALRHLFHHPWNPDWDPSETIERLRRLFARDGYTFDHEGRISGGPSIVLKREDLGDLHDATVIFEHLDRIDHAVARDDPALAIGSAKELVESTAKLVLRDPPVPFDSGFDLPKLARTAEEALLVHPSQAKPGPGWIRDHPQGTRCGAHRHQRHRRVAKRLRHRSWTRYGTVRPGTPPRATGRERCATVVPVHARHARRPESSLAAGRHGQRRQRRQRSTRREEHSVAERNLPGPNA